MDLAARPLARALSSSTAVTKGTPTNDGQVQSCDYNTPYVTVRWIQLILIEMRMWIIL